MNSSDNALKILLFQRARIINNAINRIPAAQKIIESYKRKVDSFSETIEQAEKFFSILKRNNYKAAIYHSKISPIKRQYNLFLLKNDLIDILVTCKSLDEGFDYPTWIQQSLLVPRPHHDNGSRGLGGFLGHHLIRIRH